MTNDGNGDDSNDSESEGEQSTFRRRKNNGVFRTENSKYNNGKRGTGLMIAPKSNAEKQKQQDQLK